MLLKHKGQIGINYQILFNQIRKAFCSYPSHLPNCKFIKPDILDKIARKSLSRFPLASINSQNLQFDPLRSSSTHRSSFNFSKIGKPNKTSVQQIPRYFSSNGKPKSVAQDNWLIIQSADTQKKLTLEISAQKKMNELREHVKKNAQIYNEVNIAVAIRKLAELTQVPYIIADQEVKLMWELLLDLALLRVRKLSARECALIMHSMGRVRFTTPEFFRALNLQIKLNLQDLKINQLTNILWSYTQIRLYYNEKDTETIKAICYSILPLLDEKTRQQDLCTLIWSLGELQHQDQDIIQRTFQLVLHPQFLSAMNGRQFGGLVWGYSLLLTNTDAAYDDPFSEVALINQSRTRSYAHQYRQNKIKEETVIQALVTQTYKLVDYFNPYEIASLAKSLQRFNINGEDEVWKGIKRQSLKNLGDFQVTSLVSLLYAFSKRHVPSEVRVELFDKGADKIVEWQDTADQTVVDQSLGAIVFTYGYAGHFHPKLFKYMMDLCSDRLNLLSHLYGQLALNLGKFQNAYLQYDRSVGAKPGHGLNDDFNRLIIKIKGQMQSDLNNKRKGSMQHQSLANCLFGLTISDKLDKHLVQAVAGSNLFKEIFDRHQKISNDKRADQEETNIQDFDKGIMQIFQCNTSSVLFLQEALLDNSQKRLFHTTWKAMMQQATVSDFQNDIQIVMGVQCEIPAIVEYQTYDGLYSMDLTIFIRKENRDKFLGLCRSLSKKIKVAADTQSRNDALRSYVDNVTKGDREEIRKLCNTPEIMQVNKPDKDKKNLCIAIEAHGPHHYTTNQPYYELNDSLHRTAVIRGLDWVVAPIPFYEFHMQDVDRAAYYRAVLVLDAIINDLERYKRRK